MRAALPSPPLVPRPLTIIRAPCPAPRSVCSTTFDCFLTAQIDLASPVAATCGSAFRISIAGGDARYRWDACGEVRAPVRSDGTCAVPRVVCVARGFSPSANVCVHHCVDARAGCCCYLFEIAGSSPRAGSGLLLLLTG